MIPPIALQAYTVREAIAKDLDQTMHAVADIGYRFVEYIDSFSCTTEQFARLCESLDMKIVASHVNITTLEDASQLDRLIGEAKDFGFKNIVCSHILPSERSEAQLREFPARLNIPARKLADAGIKLSFHNHEHEFVDMVDGRRLWDHLIAEFDTATVGFELDVAWVDFANEDPVHWINTLGERIPLLHIKDHVGTAEDTGRAEFTEVGCGKVDIPAIVAASPNCAAQYLVIEQDRYWVDDDPIKSAKISFDNLTKIVKDCNG